MKLIDGPDPIASKLTAVYQRLQFTEHKDFIIRFCVTQKDQITGSNAASLADEMQQLIDYFG